MRVLLVDHDSEGLETIARAIRGVLELDCVTSKGDALLLLRQNTYDVLIACERAVDGSGLDLLGRTTRTTVPLKRIFAAAPERLQLLGPRLAPFKVQRTINYPIDLEELWLAIAQVTGGPNDETDGTIERVVLDERGIPAIGSMPRGPIPPRPPAPLSGMRDSAPAVASAAGGGRAAAARLAQPAPELPLRAPPPPRAPPPLQRTPQPTQMRAPAPPMQPIPPMPMPSQASLSSAGSREILPSWTPEQPTVDDFAQVAAQARLGVQQKVVDEAARRRKQRLLLACGITLAVAGSIVFLIEKFYDPAARARQQVIAAEITRMAEQQKVTDNLTLIEVDIEDAIMKNDFDRARASLATLIERAPAHPRREFLEKSIDRAVELAKLSPQSQDKGQGQGQGQGQDKTQASAPLSAAAAPRARSTERAPQRATERAPPRVSNRAAEKTVAPRVLRDAPQAAPRTYGAPINEPPRARTQTIELDAPINSAPTMTATPRSNNSFGGRTVEASDASATRAPSPEPVPMAATPAPQSAGSAVAIPPVAAPAPAAPVDVVPAKILKRVAPVAPSGVPRKTSGYVLVRFNINESGRVSEVVVLESTPQGVFDEVAMDAVRRWIYEPRKENGVAVPQQAKARLVFDPGN